MAETNPSQADGPVYKYWAFISYSHKDKTWGDWLHRAVETYKVPGHMVGKPSRDGKIPARLFPVFRDRDELPTSGDLGSNIEEALRGSRCLIVICSPHAAASRWVDQEIRSFKALGREGRVLCLIVDGEPNGSDKPGGPPECFPEALRYKAGLDGKLTAERAEPIAADARPGQDGKDNCRLKVLAGLLGVGFDELKQRDLERRRRQRAWAAVGALVVAGALAGTWAGQERSKRLQLEAKNETLRKELAYSLLQRGWQRLSEADPFGATAFFAESNVLSPSRPAQLNAQALLYGTPEPLDVEDFTDPILSFAYVPDEGHWLISHQGRISLWDIRKRREVSSTQAQEPWFSPSPDGLRALVPGLSPMLLDWSASTSVPVSLQSDEELLAWDPLGETFLTRTGRSIKDGFTVTLWDAVLGRPLSRPFLIRRQSSAEDKIFMTQDYSKQAAQLAAETAELLKAARAMSSSMGLKPPVFSLSIPRDDGDSPGSFQLAAGGKSLVTTAGYFSGKIQIWQSGGEWRKARLPGLLAKVGTVSHVALSPDGKTLVTIKRSKELASWDWRTGAFLGASPIPSAKTVAVSPDSRWVYAGGGGGGVIRDLRRPEQGGPDLRPALAAGRSTFAEAGAAFGPGGKMLATRQVDGSWQLWDAATGGPLGGPIPWDGFHGSLARFSPDGRAFATVTDDRDIRTWGLDRVRVRYWARECDYAAAGFGGRSEAVVLWCPGYMGGLPMLHRHDIGKIRPMKDPAPPDVVSRIDAGSMPERFRALPRGVSRVLAMGDGRRMAVDFVGRLALLDADSVRALGDKKLVGPENLLFSPQADGLLLDGCMAKIWRFPGEGEVTVHDGDSCVGPASWSQDGRFLALGLEPVFSSKDEYDKIGVLDARTGTLVSDLVAHQGLSAVALSPEAMTFATMGRDRMVWFWDRQGRRVGPPMRTRATAIAAAFSPDGRTLATLEADGGVELWDVETREPLAGGIRRPPLSGYHSGEVRFSADGGALLAVAGKQPATVLWMDLRWLKEEWDPAKLRQRSALFTQRLVSGGRVQLLTGAGWRTVQAEAVSSAPHEDASLRGRNAGEESKAALKLYQSGLIHFQKMELDQAREDWTRAGKLDPSNEDVALGLKRLELLWKGDPKEPASE